MDKHLSGQNFYLFMLPSEGRSSDSLGLGSAACTALPVRQTPPTSKVAHKSSEDIKAVMKPH